MHKKLTIIYLIIFPLVTLISQNNLDISLYEYFTTNTRSNTTPHYLKSNNWGLIENTNIQSVSLASLDYDVNLFNNFNINLGGVAGFSLSDASKPLLSELYAQVNFYSLSLLVGKKRQTMGHIPDEMSSGSMIISKNASPIPKISLGFFEFTKVPYTFDLLEIKGNLAHGWLQGNRHIEGIFLHEKSLFLRLDSKMGLFFYGGVIHEAFWGGKLNGNELCEISLSNYYKIFTVDNGGEDSRIEEQINKLGNHLGIFEYGIQGYFPQIDFHLYYQHFFEDGSGQRYQNKYDGLWGIDIKPKKVYYIDAINIEFLTTKLQSGDVHNIGEEMFGGLDNYYNHYIYLNGWTHLNSILGNSFFTASGENEDLRVSNNRMEVLQLGLKGRIDDNILLQVQGAYAKYYPAYSHISLYTDGDYGWYLYGEVELKKILIDNLNLKMGLAYDFGSIIDVVGAQLSLNWSL